jgi:hypothetical protein
VKRQASAAVVRQGGIEDRLAIDQRLANESRLVLRRPQHHRRRQFGRRAPCLHGGDQAVEIGCVDGQVTGIATRPVL